MSFYSYLVISLETILASLAALEKKAKRKEIHAKEVLEKSNTTPGDDIHAGNTTDTNNNNRKPKSQASLHNFNLLSKLDASKNKIINNHHRNGLNKSHEGPSTQYPVIPLRDSNFQHFPVIQTKEGHDNNFSESHHERENVGGKREEEIEDEKLLVDIYITPPTPTEAKTSASVSIPVVGNANTTNPQLTGVVPAKFRPRPYQNQSLKQLINKIKSAAKNKHAPAVSVGPTRAKFSKIKPAEAVTENIKSTPLDPAKPTRTIGNRVRPTRITKSNISALPTTSNSALGGASKFHETKNGANRISETSQTEKIYENQETGSIQSFITASNNTDESSADPNKSQALKQRIDRNKRKFGKKSALNRERSREDDWNLAQNPR